MIALCGSNGFIGKYLLQYFSQSDRELLEVSLRSSGGFRIIREGS